MAVSSACPTSHYVGGADPLGGAGGVRRGDLLDHPAAIAAPTEAPIGQAFQQVTDSRDRR